MPHDPHLIIFHAECLDGWTAAWLFHQKYPNGTFVPARHGSYPPENVTGKDIIVVDFAYNEPLLIGLKSQAASIKVLDHHQSAFDALKHLPFCFFDLNKSGARLAWEELYNRKKSPWLVDYVEDVDLWKFDLPYSKEVNCYISTIPHTFDNWTKLSKTPFKTVIEKGKVILKYREQLVREHVARAKETCIAEHFVMATNCTCLSLVSDVATALAIGKPFGACYYVDAQGHKCWSLRSTDDGEDVSLIAKKYGGGGHPHAAGFRSL